MDNRWLKTRALIVIIVTLFAMFFEIYFGVTTKSMALTVDGLHMGTHVFVLGIAYIICIFAVKYQEKSEKFNAIGGYTSAILLGLTSFGIIIESVERLFKPLTISYTDAIIVASIGFVVNLTCAFILHNHNNLVGHCHNCVNENLNYKAAYLHIISDVIVSVFALIALFCGKYFGITYLDPVMGIIGGLIIARWAFGLIKTSLLVLADFNK